MSGSLLLSNPGRMLKSLPKFSRVGVRALGRALHPGQYTRVPCSGAAVVIVCAFLCLPEVSMVILDSGGFLDLSVMAALIAGGKGLPCFYFLADITIGAKVHGLLVVCFTVLMHIA